MSLLVASREDIASGLKHLSPSAKEWVSLVTRAIVKQQQTQPQSQSQSSNQKKDKDQKDQKDQAKKSRDSDSNNNDNNDTNEDTDDDNDEFDDLVKFVFDSDAENPWDERLHYKVVHWFDAFSHFLNQPTVAGELDARSALGRPGFESLEAIATSLNLEAGGRISLRLERAASLKPAIQSAQKLEKKQPRVALPQLDIELKSAAAAVEKEREKASLRVKLHCDPFLNAALKTTAALYDFDDTLTDRFLGEDLPKLLRKKLDAIPHIAHFDDYWQAETKKLNVKPKAAKKPASASSSASSEPSELEQLDSLWEKYVENVTAAADLCITFISQETISQIVTAAHLLQTKLVQSLQDMVSLCSPDSLTADIQEIIDGTNMNLSHFKEFLDSESALHRSTHTESHKALSASLKDLSNLYYSTPPNTQPTSRGRLERTRSKDFLKKVKLFEQEQSSFRMSLLTNLHEFAENIQWDGLVLGVEVIGASLEVCQEDVEAAHEPLQQEWEDLVEKSGLVDKWTALAELYKEGVQFGLVEYVKAVGKPLLEAMNKVPPAQIAAATAASSGSVAGAAVNGAAKKSDVKKEIPATNNAAAAAAPKKKKNKKAKKKGSASAVQSASAATGKAGKDEEADEDEEEVVATTAHEQENEDMMQESDDEPEPPHAEKEEDDEDDDLLDLDSAIPPQYSQRPSSESLHRPSTPTTAASPAPVPPSSQSPVLKQHNPIEWPKKVIPTPNAAIPATVSAATPPPALLPPNLAPPNLTQQLPILAEQSQQQQLYAPTPEEFHHLRLAYSHAMRDLNHHRTERMMLLQEVHRLQSEVLHWKTLFAQQQQQQQQQQQHNPWPPGMTPPLSGPPGIQALAGQLGDLFLQPQLQQQPQPKSQSPVLPSPVGTSQPQQQHQQQHQQQQQVRPSSQPWRASRGGGGGVIGGEKRLQRPPQGLQSSPKDGASAARRAFLRGTFGRDVRCGNCGEAGHESGECGAPCRYCGEVGHLAAQCPY